MSNLTVEQPKLKLLKVEVSHGVSLERGQNKKEVERYLQLLKQEDNRYEFESSNVGKIEHEIIKMYKKGK